MCQLQQCMEPCWGRARVCVVWPERTRHDVHCQDLKLVSWQEHCNILATIDKCGYNPLEKEHKKYTETWRNNFVELCKCLHWKMVNFSRAPLVEQVNWKKRGNLQGTFLKCLNNLLLLDEYIGSPGSWARWSLVEHSIPLKAHTNTRTRIPLKTKRTYGKYGKSYSISLWTLSVPWRCSPHSLRSRPECKLNWMLQDARNVK